MRKIRIIYLFIYYPSSNLPYISALNRCLLKQCVGNIQESPRVWILSFSRMRTIPEMTDDIILRLLQRFVCHYFLLCAQMLIALTLMWAVSTWSIWDYFYGKRKQTINKMLLTRANLDHSSDVGKEKYKGCKNLGYGEKNDKTIKLLCL